MKAAAWPAPSPAGGRHRQAPLGRRQVREPAPRRATAEQVSERSARGVAPVQAPTRAADAAGRISPPCTALPFRHARIHEQFRLRRHRLTAVRHRAARTPRRPPASSPKNHLPAPAGVRHGCPPIRGKISAWPGVRPPTSRRRWYVASIPVARTPSATGLPCSTRTSTRRGWATISSGGSLPRGQVMGGRRLVVRNASWLICLWRFRLRADHHAGASGILDLAERPHRSGKRRACMS